MSSSEQKTSFIMTYSWSAAGMIQDIGCGEYVEISALQRSHDDVASLILERDALRAQMAEAHALFADVLSIDVPRTAQSLERMRAILSGSAEQKCETCHDQGEVFVSKGKVEYGMLTEPEPIYKPCPDCAEPANKERAQ